MYEFVRSPLVWIGFLGLILGSLYQIVAMARAAGRDGSIYPTLDARFGLRSVLHWVVPFGSRSMRLHPVVTVVSFAFHFCLLLTPLLVMGHAVLWEQSWGVSWWSLPPAVADAMTLVVVLGGLFFMLRRLAAPEVRNVSTVKDFLLLLLVIAPFVTGYLAHLRWLPPRALMIVHIITGVIWLLAIPFTWLSHALWFGFSRAFMGSEFGKVRNARDW